MDIDISSECYICRSNINKPKRSFICKCKSRVCENCWKSIMCYDCFDKLPYEKKELVENFDQKLKKKRNINRIINYIIFPALILATFIFELPFWTMYVYFGLSIVFSIFFHTLPLIRLKKKIWKKNYSDLS